MKRQILTTYAMTLEQAKKLVAEVPNDRFAEMPFDEAKHPGWVLGHLCVGSDMMLQHLTHPTVADPGLAFVPESWAASAMPGVAVSGERGAFAEKDELLVTLEDLHMKLSIAFDTASDELLDTPFPNPEYRSFFPTIGDASCYLMAYHEGYHLGQLSSWRRAAGFGPAPE
ncbi:MAG: DinB family protein [Planctomycetota bacterium]